MRDAVGIGESKDAAGLGRIDAFIAFDMDLALDLARGVAGALQAAAIERQARRQVTRGVSLAYKLDAQAQIGIASLRRGADDVALHQQRGDGASEPALAARFGGERHMREARMQRQRRDRFALFGDAAGIVERGELYQ